MSPIQVSARHIKLAKHVMLSLNIPNGDQLVFAFGTGDESNNIEAIAHWIKEIEGSIDLDDLANMITFITKATQEHLEEIIL